MTIQNEFWYPVHEAGHLTVLYALGLEVDYAIASRTDVEGVTFRRDASVDVASEVSFSYGLKHDAEIELAICAAGFAAELLVWEKERKDVTEKDFVSAAFERCQSDMSAAFRNIEFRGSSLERDQYWVSSANRLSRAIISKNERYFISSRRHLAQWGVAGSLSLAAIAKGDAATFQAVKSDFAALSRAKHADLIGTRHRSMLELEGLD